MHSLLSNNLCVGCAKHTHYLSLTPKPCTLCDLVCGQKYYYSSLFPLPPLFSPWLTKHALVALPLLQTLCFASCMQGKWTSQVKREEVGGISKSPKGPNEWQNIPLRQLN